MRRAQELLRYVGIYIVGIVSIPKNNISRNIALYFTQSFMTSMQCLSRSILDSAEILDNLSLLQVKSRPRPHSLSPTVHTAFPAWNFQIT